MARKNWPTDPAEVRRSIEEAIQELVRMGLVMASGAIGFSFLGRRGYVASLEDTNMIRFAFGRRLISLR